MATRSLPEKVRISPIHGAADAVSSTVSLKLEDVSKTYQTSFHPVKAIRSVSLEVPQGQFLSIMGPSGSGKSTLLHILGCLDNLSSGTYRVGNTDVGRMSEAELARIRNERFGFVFQAYHLIPTLNALENVALPLKFAGVRKGIRRNRAKALLEEFGLQDCMQRLPAELSGGQQQRVAIARALANRPSAIFADEPTGNLDSKAGQQVMKILTDLNKAGVTVIMVTHDEDIGRHAQRVLRIEDGEIADDRVLSN